MDDPVIAGLVLTGVLLALLTAGLWIFAAIMAVAIFALVVIKDFSLVRVGLNLQPTFWRSATSYELASLPMFIWMAEILFRTRMSDEIFKGLAPWLTRVPGRLLHINVIGCGLFGSVSGSSAATCATIAKIALPELKRRGYDEKIAIGSLAGSATLGILIPPSITMVIYAIAAEVSLIRLFLAGFLPGLLVMALYSGYIAAWSIRHPEKAPPAEEHATFRQKLAASRELIPCLGLIVFIFIVLLMGWFTPTECAAAGVIASLAIARWSGTLSWTSFWESVEATTRLTAMIAIILCASAFMSSAMGFSGIPGALARWVGSQNLSPYMLIAALTIAYIVLGTALDGVSLIVLTMPVVLPLIKQAGFDLVWFGIFMILVIEMAEVSPPVGFNLFVLQNMTGKDSLYVGAAALPFFFLLVVAVAIITVFPSVVMVLPDLSFGKE